MRISSAPSSLRKRAYDHNVADASGACKDDIQKKQKRFVSPASVPSNGPLRSIGNDLSGIPGGSFNRSTSIRVIDADMRVVRTDETFMVPSEKSEGNLPRVKHGDDRGTSGAGLDFSFAKSRDSVKLIDGVSEMDYAALSKGIRSGIASNPQSKNARVIITSALRSTAVARSTLKSSKFKPPTRVGTAPVVARGVDNSQHTQRASNSALLSGTPSDGAPLLQVNEKGKERRWNVEEKVQSDYYCVMYCIRKINAKHKGPWSDGIIICRGRSCVLQDTEGKVITKDAGHRSGDMSEGAMFPIGKYEVEVMRKSSEEEFLSGQLFVQPVDMKINTNIKVALKRPFKVFKRPESKQKSDLHMTVVTSSTVPTSNLHSTGICSLSDHQNVKDNGLVLNTREVGGGAVPVIVDPYVGSKLRSHQREGVKFMYECVMGLRSSSFSGCLLADAMGLGKTLQVIALIWTLIQQGPRGRPAVKRVLVICPSSLVENWRKEVRKWLGSERLNALVIHSGTSAKDVKRNLSNFHVGKVYHLLITSYELLRKHKDELKEAKPGLLVCDEAHRLKNCAGNKTIDALLALGCPKKVLLTGTPIQNDLMEFYAMIDFTNPNLLGPLSAFKRLYADPIEKSRDRNASDEEKKLGRARSAELQARTRSCILQRTADINSKYLPQRTELVVFCKLQAPQVSLYQRFLKSKTVETLLLPTNHSAGILSAIGTLRKLCNHPKLVHDLCKEISSKTEKGHEEFPSQPHGRKGYEDWRVSGKFACLYRILSAVHESSNFGSRDKIVVVSNFTQTLDIIQTLCEMEGWRLLRLDGSTDVCERQSMVDRFNAGCNIETVFLLSSKAGGSGLNLIGANRLVLFDPDWNPATDAQAMARVWRDGQKKPVVIYRLLTTGSIEEKIYQRQIMKGEVAAAVEEHGEGKGSGGRHFSREEIRELFTLRLETSCDTFDLLSQSAGWRGWRDFSNELEDFTLKEAIQTGVVTFVHKKVDKREISVDNPSDPLNRSPEFQTTEDGCQQDTHVMSTVETFSDFDQPPSESDDEGGEEHDTIEREDAELLTSNVQSLGGGDGPNICSSPEEIEVHEAQLNCDKPSDPSNCVQHTIDCEELNTNISAERVTSLDSERQSGSLLDSKKHEINDDTNETNPTVDLVNRAREEFNCLLETGKHTIINLMLKSLGPVDCTVDELEALDMPFLSSLELEIELKKANFASKDLWHGFKLFATGFLSEEEDGITTYNNSKLGLILDTCNGDKTANSESLFCKGLPLVRAALSRDHGDQAAFLPHLLHLYEREEELLSTPHGRFLVEVLKRSAVAQ